MFHANKITASRPLGIGGNSLMSVRECVFWRSLARYLLDLVPVLKCSFGDPPSRANPAFSKIYRCFHLRQGYGGTRRRIVPIVYFEFMDRN